MTKSVLISAIILIAILAIAGCNVHQPLIQETGYYDLHPQADFESINHMVIMEFDNRTNFTKLAEPLSRQVFSTVIKKHMFDTTFITWDQPLWKQIAGANLEHAERETQKAYAEMLNSDAIMTGEIIQYKPFPTLMIGLRVRIIDLRTGYTIWKLEQVWDSADIGVENRIKRYYSNTLKSGLEPMGWQYVRTSPSAYRQFVAYEIAQTLPGGNYYTNEYIEYEKDPASLKDKLLRPVVRFPKTAMDTVGM